MTWENFCERFSVTQTNVMFEDGVERSVRCLTRKDPDVDAGRPVTVPKVALYGITVVVPPDAALVKRAGIPHQRYDIETYDDGTLHLKYIALFPVREEEERGPIFDIAPDEYEEVFEGLCNDPLRMPKRREKLILAEIARTNGILKRIRWHFRQLGYLFRDLDRADLIKDLNGLSLPSKQSMELPPDKVEEIEQLEIQDREEALERLSKEVVKCTAEILLDWDERVVEYIWVRALSNPYLKPPQAETEVEVGEAVRAEPVAAPVVNLVEVTEPVVEEAPTKGSGDLFQKRGRRKGAP